MVTVALASGDQGETNMNANSGQSLVTPAENSPQTNAPTVPGVVEADGKQSCMTPHWWQLRKITAGLAADKVIICHFDGLDVGIHDRRTNEAESTTLERLGECVGFG